SRRRRGRHDHGRRGGHNHLRRSRHGHRGNGGPGHHGSGRHHHHTGGGGGRGGGGHGSGRVVRDLDRPQGDGWGLERQTQRRADHRLGRAHDEHRRDREPRRRGGDVRRR